MAKKQAPTPPQRPAHNSSMDALVPRESAIATKMPSVRAIRELAAANRKPRTIRLPDGSVHEVGK
jgi:hypothetical protein